MGEPKGLTVARAGAVAIFVDSKLPSFFARFTNCISAEVALLNITTRVPASTSRLFVSRRISLLKPPLKHEERKISGPYIWAFNWDQHCKIDYESPIPAPNTLVL
jgi:hypothetical protein